MMGAAYRHVLRQGNEPIPYCFSGEDTTSGTVGKLRYTVQVQQCVLVAKQTTAHTFYSSFYGDSTVTDIATALTELGNRMGVVRANFEAEFNEMFRKVTGADANGSAIESDNPDDLVQR